MIYESRSTWDWSFEWVLCFKVGNTYVWAQYFSDGFHSTSHYFEFHSIIDYKFGPIQTQSIHMWCSVGAFCPIWIGPHSNQKWWCETPEQQRAHHSLYLFVLLCWSECKETEINLLSNDIVTVPFLKVFRGNSRQYYSPFYPRFTP